MYGWKKVGQPIIISTFFTNFAKLNVYMNLVKFVYL